MGAIIKFNEIKSVTVKKNITQTDVRFGRLTARSTIGKIKTGDVLDVLLLHDEYAVKSNGETVCLDTFDFTAPGVELEIDESNIKDRHRYQKSDMSDNSLENGRVALGTKFMKRFKNGNIFIVILHQ